ncbi:hypothetical protein [Streptomyces sp. NPDC047028]|uniref:hypothetical protein n=1 Tax=Streptomyces sp. NPDC047028 TaxID=3155793 RepID=UPI0033F7F68D
MGVWGRYRWWPRGARVVAVAGVVVVGAGVVAGCDPGGLSSTTAAYTTDKTATAELKRQHVNVAWLTCTGRYQGGQKAYTPGKTPAPTQRTVISVDCQGRTKDGRKITVTGKVTRAVDGACVRGDLTAKVAGRQVFHVSGLGDCGATPAPTRHQPGTHGPAPAVTVTVTRTIWCKGDPTCWPVRGK